MNIAIITGASSGIGVEFLKEMQKEELDEIWVIARRKEKLEEICRQHSKIAHRVLPFDITNQDCLVELASILEKEKPNVRFLFNNAGFGIWGAVKDSNYLEQGKMVKLNAQALTEITSIVVKYMSKCSCIINTCSIASFVPNAYMSVYSATKAYVLSYTKSLRYELKKEKINVTAICPGPMATEFLDVAGLDKGVSRAFDKLPYCDPSKTARKGIRAAKKGKCIYTPRAFYKFYRVLSKMLPHSWLLPLSKT